jgi:hypothetical protein
MARNAEAGQRDEQDRDRVQDESDRGNACNGDLGQLEVGGDRPFVVTVGQLSTKGGQNEEGCQQHDARQRYEDRCCLRVGCGDLRAEAEQDQHTQCILEEVVVERRAELAPEQRREPAGRQQRLGHAAFLGSFRPAG